MTSDKDAADTRQAPAPQAAFDELHDKLKKPIYNFFANRGCPKEEARDLRQETFLRVFERLDSFQGDSKLETWIFGIAKNVWLHRVRDRNRLKRRGIEVSIDGEEDTEARDPLKSRLAADDCPFEDASRAEQSRLVVRALGQLPESMRQCLWLWFDQELQYREIASVLQITISQVKTNLARGKGRLQKILKDHRTEVRPREGLP